MLRLIMKLDTKVCTVCGNPGVKHEYERKFPTPKHIWQNPLLPKYQYRRLCDGQLVKAA